MLVTQESGKVSQRELCWGGVVVEGGKILHKLMIITKAEAQGRSTIKTPRADLVYFAVLVHFGLTSVQAVFL